MIGEYIENLKYINEELNAEHLNKKTVAQLLAGSLIELKKISIKLNLPIEEITVKHIVLMLKNEEL